LSQKQIQDLLDLLKYKPLLEILSQQQGIEAEIVLTSLSKNTRADTQVCPYNGVL